MFTYYVIVTLEFIIIPQISLYSLGRSKKTAYINADLHIYLYVFMCMYGMIHFSQ